MSIQEKTNNYRVEAYQHNTRRLLSSFEKMGKNELTEKVYISKIDAVRVRGLSTAK